MKTANHEHKFPMDNRCWQVICSIIMFGGKANHVHCEICGDTKKVEVKE